MSAATETSLYVLRMEPTSSIQRTKPWVARVHGLHPRYTLAREFLRPMQDWADASVSRKGVVSGVVPTFALRVGWVVEVQRITKRGQPFRSFGRVTEDGIEEMSSREVIEWAAQQQTA